MNKTKYVILVICVVFNIDVIHASDKHVQTCVDSAPDDIGQTYVLYYVPSDGAIANTTTIALSKMTGFSAAGKKLAKFFKKGRTTELAVMVCGPSTARSAQVAMDALKYSIKKKRKLPKLTIIYVGHASHIEKLQELATEVDAKVLFSELRLLAD